MNKPRWQKQAWTLARLAALLAGLSRRRRGFTVDEIKKRYGIGIRDLITLSRRLGGHEDMGTQAWHHLDLRLDYDDQGRLEIGSIGADALAAMTRLSKEDALVAAEALEGLALASKKRALAKSLGARLRVAVGRAALVRSLLYRPGESPAERGRVEIVSEAVEEGLALSFDYHGAGARSKGRQARPLTLRRDGRVWRTLAWDQHRRALRVFRLEHMHQIRPDTADELPEDLDLAALKNRDLAQFTPRGDETLVKMKVSARVYNEFKPAFKKSVRKLAKGRKVVTLLAASPAWLVKTFLPYAAEVQVTSPPAYKKAMAAEIEAIKRRHR